MEISDKKLKRYNITRQQFKDLQKIEIDIQYFINTFEKNIITQRIKKIKNIKDAIK